MVTTAATSSAPTPADVAAVVPRLAYKPGWSFKVGGPLGSMLCVFATTPDSHSPNRQRTTQHQFTLPGPDVDFVAWVFECLLLCELHEAGEFFAVAGSRPFFPHHQDEGSPYVRVDRRTSAQEGDSHASICIG